MSFELSGEVIEVFDTNQVSDSFKKREFVVEHVETNAGKEYKQQIKFQMVQDKCDKLDALNIGDAVTVSFGIRGRRWEKDGKVNYFNNLEAWKVELTDPF